MEGSTRNQYLATFCGSFLDRRLIQLTHLTVFLTANLMAWSYGSFCGWPSAAFLVLQSADSPMTDGPISNEEASWIGAIICVGGLTGNFFFGWLSNKLGRKVTLILTAIPMLAAFIIIPFAESVTHLCMSRFLGGFGGGGAFAIIPIYITEIAEDR